MEQKHEETQRDMDTFWKASSRRGALSVFVWMCCVLSTSLVAAQEMGSSSRDLPPEEIVLKVPAARQGYFVSAGAALVLNLNDSDDDDVDPIYGTFLNLRLGEMVNEWLGFGVQIDGGFGSGGEDRWSMGFGGLMLDVQFVPIQVEGWNHLSIRFGVGAGGLSLTDAESKDDELKGTGGAYYGAAIAYDIFPFYEKGSGGWAVTPTLQAQLLPGEVFAGYIMTAGVEFTWWSGLNKNRLELSVDEAFTKEDD